LTLAVVAGLLLLPGRLLGPDRPVRVAVPSAAQRELPAVQAAPPLVIRHRPTPQSKNPASAPTLATAQRFTYVARPRTVVRVSPARRLLATHRSAVISKLAPTAPLVRARVLAAASTPRHVAHRASSTAKTIAALAASLSKD
jgi:hypothetical protein